MGAERRGDGAPHGELRCHRARIEHLREAMPFDEVEVEVAVVAVRRCGLEPSFDFYRHTGGSREKIAWGEYVGGWYEPASGSWRLAPMPQGRARKDGWIASRAALAPGR